MLMRRLITRVLPSMASKRLFFNLQMQTSAIIRKNREPEMFCHQCAQTTDGLYCDQVSVCGKTVEQSKLQALLLNLNQTISQYINILNQNKSNVDTIPYSQFLLETSFSTLTNVNFDESQAVGYIKKLTQMKDELKALVQKQKVTIPQSLLSNDFVFKNDPVYLTNEGKKHSVWNRFEKHPNVDAFALREFIRYGIKGVSAYLTHAERIRAFTNNASIPFYNEEERKAMFDGLTRAWVKIEEPNLTVDELFQECLNLGGVNLQVMRALSSSHETALGVPVPNTVATRPAPGPAILVSGHDMTDLKIILEATEGKGVNVYTHGEMMPAHSYPELRKHKHLKGNLGGAWYNQGGDFAKFRGAILLTSNCLMPPKSSYKGRLFTTGSVGFAGVPHVEPKDFNKVVESALKFESFTQSYIDEVYPEKTCKEVSLGFGHKTVLNLANVVIDAIKKGDLKSIFLIGGCDGFEPQRKYFGDLANVTPNESLVLTMGCAKFRVNKHQLGNLGNSGIPRVLDMGQCNDSYSAVVVALELAKALGTTVNDLPLYLAVAWFEQKAVAVLLTLLHLGIKNIRLGPIAPAFLTPNIAKMLNEKFNLHIANTKDAKGDLVKMLAEKNQ